MFITDKDEQLKADKEKEKNKIKDEFEEKVREKFDDIIDFKHFKGSGVTNSNLNKLLEDERLDREKDRKAIKALKKKGVKIQIIALLCYLIPIEVIRKRTIYLIEKNGGYTTLAEISEILEQYDYLTSKTAKNAFIKFLKDFFENDEFAKDELQYTEKFISIIGVAKKVRNSVTLPKEKLKELKAIKDKKLKEEYVKNEAKKLEEKYQRITETLESYNKLIDDESRHIHYDMDIVHNEVERLKIIKKENTPLKVDTIKLE